MNKLQKLFVVFCLFVIHHNSYCQLNNFTLTVVATDETCTGNGTLTFNVQNTNPGATIVYSVYLFPNLATPISVLTTTTFTGISAGNYRVVAVQSLGNLSNSQQQDVQINSLIVPLIYQVIGIPQICLNDGSITVTVTQGNPVTYEIITGLIIVPPQTSNVFNGLPPGTYNIRVNDACGDGIVQTYTLGTQTQTPSFVITSFNTDCNLINCSTISSLFTIEAIDPIGGGTIPYPLTVEFTVLPPGGGSPININQVITSGGTTEQNVNLNIPFYHGQTYFYTIKVTDSCGLMVVYNGQINKSLTLDLSGQPLNSCVKAINLELCNFLAPYTVTFLSSPAGFNPTTFNVNHPGPFSGVITYESSPIEVPDGNYVVQVTDACGHIAQDSIYILNSGPDYEILSIGNDCDATYFINIPYLGPDVTSVIITNAPSQLNFTFPYDVSSTIVDGQFGMALTVPGIYIFTGINICGDPFSFNIVVPVSTPSDVVAIGYANSSCNISNGLINMEIHGGPTLVSVILIQAPSNYNGILPQDISQYIIHPDDTSLSLGNSLPVGDYTFNIIDSCGIEYQVSANVPVVISQAPLEIIFIRGCETGSSSVRLSSFNSGLETVRIIGAPSSYIPTLPHDVSFNIAIDNRFYMNSLTPGNYIFYSKDFCGFELITNILIPDYTVVQDNIAIQANCGSFNVVMDYVVNETYQHRYWLQKFNPNTSQWGHPITGVVYPAGSSPNFLNSYQLEAGIINYNIFATGIFRILKRHFIFSNGIDQLTECLEVIKEFDYNGDLKIISAYTFPCSNGSNEVLINAQGALPLTYKITTKNGLPFLVDNGTSNIFSGLAPAIYNFQVQDICGNIVNRLFDINSLPEPTIISENLCNGQNGQLSVQGISFLNYQWWKGTDTTTILSTTNVLSFNPFSSLTTPGTYYVRIYSTSPLSCVDRTISYVVPSVSNPNAGNDVTISFCDASNAVNLFSILVAPFDSNGTWVETTSSGMLNGSIWLPIGIPFGTYVFTYTVVGFCSDLDIATVTINFNEGPSIPAVTSLPEICGGNTIELNVDDIANATFSWFGPNNFTSNNQNIVIQNTTVANSGTYTVNAMLNGCTSSSSIDVIVNPTPNFTIDARCINDVYTATVLPVDSSFNSTLVTYNWSGPNGYYSNENPIYLTSNSGGIYTVVVTNPENCSETNSVDVQNTLCFITNVITPNNDGSNESFDLTGLDVEKLEIYSRWGRLVYESNNYIDQWHGQNMNGGRLPDSTYFYFIFLRNGEEKRGWVFLAANN